MAGIQSEKVRAPGIFGETRWTLIERLQSQHWSESALNELCEIYRPPVLRFICMLGQSEQDAEDLTQDFFLRSLKNELFENADRKCGKLRSFICISLHRFIIDRAREQKAKKRGGDTITLPLDAEQLENRL